MAMELAAEPSSTTSSAGAPAAKTQQADHSVAHRVNLHSPTTNRIPAPRRKPGPPVWLTTQDWELAVACAGLDPDIFYRFETERGVTRRAHERAAKQVCRRCPVADQCLVRALTADEPHGIWGGLTPDERADLVHQATA